jgi:EAL and modified HD-GYP domain-containing signal transduction protein
MRSEYQPSEVDGTLRAKDFVMACQPIFSRDLDVFAYELLFRRCIGDECAVISDYDDATSQIIADGFTLASQRLGKNGKVTINVGCDNIVSRNVLALPSDRALLEIPGDTQTTGDFLGAAKELRKAGYQFLVDNYDPDSPGACELLAVADYVKVPVNGLDGKRVAQVKRSLSGWNGKTVAARVENWEAYAGCKYLGFDFFQGFFFAYPKDLVGKKISSFKTARLKLLQLLSDEEASLSEIVNVISADQALSIRLLNFVNSVAFSLENRVDSLKRAASLVGLNTLKKWAMSAALSDLDSSGKGVELSFMAMHGATFLGLLAEKHTLGDCSAETLYLLGLLNNVDALMGMKMKEVVDGMPLLAVVKKALVRDPQEPLTRFLQLLDAIGRGDWNQAQTLLRAVGIPLSMAATLYLQAGRDVGELMASLTKTN